MLDVMVVGQTPPPVHGQSLMIQQLLAGSYQRVRLHHVRMAFSASIDDIARVRLGKVTHLASLIRRIIALQSRCGATLLYYPPAGPNRVPVYRDIALLLAIRHLFAHTLFHFHAGGLSALYPQLTPPMRWLFDRAYGRPDLAILLSEHNPPDGKHLGARRNLVIPYGIEDNPPYPGPHGSHLGRAPVILFVGAVRASKGVDTLLTACSRLHQRGCKFRLEVVGPFSSAAFERKAHAFVNDRGLTRHVSFLGEKTGADKWSHYARADILCFPSYYASETFGLVVLEAMRYGLPVVATRWRGITSLVRDGETGFLVQPRDDAAVAARLEELLGNPDARRNMGARGRARYEAEFTIERWYARMEAAMLAAAGTQSESTSAR